MRHSDGGQSRGALDKSCAVRVGNEREAGQVGWRRVIGEERPLR